MNNLGSLFLAHAAEVEREPIHSGEPCCICDEVDGRLEEYGYHEVLGLQWIHPECRALAEQAIAKYEARKKQEYAQKMKVL
ncbi:MAG: hypothetical protein HN390_01460 [Anaerolineae bacterium]|jgi:hypothetical protein|nr:hypothetical protein [Anaerolineae bacterium]MBT7192121.1 hypothetical protein [Anaerolineae bacterium]